jgi:folate-dependent phosphoribosylglycinamide formyltransferase PurN
MPSPTNVPSVVFLCHEDDTLDTEGLTRWLAGTMRLAGVIVVAPSSGRLLRAARRQVRRSGLTGLADALALRALYAIRHGRRDRAWTEAALDRLRAAHPVDLSDVPRLRVRTPNSDEARRFLRARQPDLMLARCKVILKPDVFGIPRLGTFVLHPGICPEYRNAHGCFWALARRDLGRVGLTLLRVDEGVDTGPIYLQASCAFDERRESHVRIQTRVLLDNLDDVARALRDVARGEAAPIDVAGRQSAVWGHPTLSAYWRWKRAARRAPAIPQAAAD